MLNCFSNKNLTLLFITNIYTAIDINSNLFFIIIEAFQQTIILYQELRIRLSYLHNARKLYEAELRS